MPNLFEWILQWSVAMVTVMGTYNPSGNFSYLHYVRDPEASWAWIFMLGAALLTMHVLYIRTLYLSLLLNGFLSIAGLIGAVLILLAHYDFITWHTLWWDPYVRLYSYAVFITVGMFWGWMYLWIGGAKLKAKYGP